MKNVRFVQAALWNHGTSCSVKVSCSLFDRLRACIVVVFVIGDGKNYEDCEVSACLVSFVDVEVGGESVVAQYFLGVATAPAVDLDVVPGVFDASVDVELEALCEDPCACGRDGRRGRGG